MATKKEPNIKTFPFVENWVDEIHEVTAGFFHNKKILVAIAVKRLHENATNLDTKNSKTRFIETLLVDAEEIGDLTDEKLRIGNPESSKRVNEGK